MRPEVGAVLLLPGPGKGRLGEVVSGLLWPSETTSEAGWVVLALRVLVRQPPSQF